MVLWQEREGQEMPLQFDGHLRTILLQKCDLMLLVKTCLFKVQNLFYVKLVPTTSTFRRRRRSLLLMGEESMGHRRLFQ